MKKIAALLREERLKQRASNIARVSVDYGKNYFDSLDQVDRAEFIRESGNLFILGSKK